MRRTCWNDVENPLGFATASTVETLGRVGEPLLRVLRVPIGTIEGRLGTCLILLSSRLCLQCLLELLAHSLDATPGFGDRLVRRFELRVGLLARRDGLVGG